MPAIPYLTRQSVVLVKLEATYNDATVPAAADAVLIGEQEVSIDGEVLNRDYMSDALGRFRPLIGRILIKLSGTVELKGPGVAYTALVRPEADPILRCCGQKATLGGAPGTETVTYTPQAIGAFESAAIDVFLGGKMLRMKGCFGTGRYLFEAGQIAKFQFEITGIWSDDADAAIPAVAAVYDTLSPPIVQSGALTLGARSLILAKIEVDVGCKVSPRLSVNGVRGLYGVAIVDRDPVGSLDPEAEPDASTLTDIDTVTHTMTGLVHDFPTAAYVLVGPAVGTVQYNRMVFGAPQLTPTGIKPGDRDGMRIFEYPFTLARPVAAPNTEFSLVLS